jgi:hypothetical protein
MYRMKAIRTRKVTISLKQDITKVIEQYGKYAWILHDKDANPETGELIEPHYHIFLEFPNARSLTSIANELGIEPNMVQVVRDKKGILNYFTHSRSPEKYQYDIKEVHANFEVERESEEGLNMIMVFELLEKSESVKHFVAELCKRGLSGNPLTNSRNANALWNEYYAEKREEEERRYR